MRALSTELFDRVRATGGLRGFRGDQATLMPGRPPTWEEQTERWTEH